MEEQPDIKILVVDFSRLLCTRSWKLQIIALLIINSQIANSKAH